VRALRRVLTIVLTTGLLAAPLAVAQQAVKIPRIGLLGAASASGYASQLEAFRQGLRALGWVEGQNIAIEYRWAEGRYDRLADLAAELVRLKVDVILTHGTPGTQAAKRATTTIPIVVVVAGDAVATGLVKSLARPGGNVTGSSFFLPELSAKRLELLREVLPEASRIGVLLNAGNAVHGLVRRGLDSGARAMKVELQYVAARGPSDLDRAFDALTAGRNQGLVVVDDGMLIANAGRIADLATRKRLPTIGFSELAGAGALMSYGVSFPDLWRQAPTFVDRILKGARPSELPIEQASRFELKVNLNEWAT
jgi:putative ABC transport system substrate-binding protein